MPETIVVRIPKKKKMSIQRMLLSSFNGSQYKKQLKPLGIRTPIHNSTSLEKNNNKFVVLPFEQG